MIDQHTIAAAVTLNHYTEPTNLDVIRTEAQAELRRQIEAGKIDTTGMRSLIDYQVEELWRSADTAAEAEQARIRRAKSGGQGVLDYGDDYDRMVLVCRGRRTTLGRLTAEDRQLMAEESRDNRIKIDRADAEEQIAAKADILILQKFADYESYDKHRKTRKAAS